MEYLKERWQEMDWGRRVVLLAQPALFLLALVLHLTFGQQQVVSYRDGHLRYERQGETAVYSGRVDGHRVKFAVSSPSLVEFWLDGAPDGVYAIAQDPSAIPQTESIADFDPDFFTGVEIKKDGAVWFRGAWSPYSSYWLLDVAGNNLFLSITAHAEFSKPDPEPDPAAILRFANGPELSPRGHGLLLLLGLFVAAACALSLLFEAQIFRWNLSFRVQDPYGAEPSEWELFGRWVGWITLTGLAVFVYAIAAGLVLIS